MSNCTSNQGDHPGIKPDAGMVESHIKDIAMLKVKVDAHDSLFSTFASKLDTISKDFAKIKNWIVGGVALYILQQVGVVELIKSYFKILSP